MFYLSIYKPIHVCKRKNRERTALLALYRRSSFLSDLFHDFSHTRKDLLFEKQLLKTIVQKQVWKKQRSLVQHFFSTGMCVTRVLKQRQILQSKTHLHWRVTFE